MFIRDCDAGVRQDANVTLLKDTSDVIDELPIEGAQDVV
jgi:hypothetical protein